MIPNRISVVLSKEDFDEIMAAIELIKSKLPFLLSLTGAEIQGMVKMGTNGMGFVEKAYEVASQYLDMMPRNFDLGEMEKDITALKFLLAIATALTPMKDQIDDTAFLLANEAYLAALAVYAQAQLNGKDLGLDSLISDMGKRFARKLAKKADEPAKAES